MFGQDAYNRKRLGIENFVDIVPPSVKNEILKHDKNADIKCAPSKRGKKNVGEMKGKKTAAKETKVCKPWKRVTLKFSGEGEVHNVEIKLH